MLQLLTLNHRPTWRGHGRGMGGMGGMAGSLGVVEWIFLTSPRVGTGPAAPNISDGRELDTRGFQDMKDHERLNELMKRADETQT